MFWTCNIPNSSRHWSFKLSVFADTNSLKEFSWQYTYTGRETARERIIYATEKDLVELKTLKKQTKKTKNSLQVSVSPWFPIVYVIICSVLLGMLAQIY